MPVLRPHTLPHSTTTLAPPLALPARTRGIPSQSAQASIRKRHPLPPPARLVAQTFGRVVLGLMGGPGQPTLTPRPS